jgi:hypothetical protein
MCLLEALASIFINVFGITQPTPKMRRKAAWFILVLLEQIPYYCEVETGVQYRFSGEKRT